MLKRTTLLLALTGALAGCTPPPPAPTQASAATADDAQVFVQQINNEAYQRRKESAAAAWVAATYINDDTQLLAAKANERDLAYQADILARAKAYKDLQLDPHTRRALQIIVSGNTILPPANAAEQSELTTLAARLEAHYGSAKACPDPAKPDSCRDLIELSRVLAESRDPAALRQAWTDWHDTARSQRADYQRFAELMNAGAREYGYKDTGELWRSGYDMSPQDFSLETERLWSQVQPLYQSLQCYVRRKLSDTYGETEVPKTGLIPGHVLGNMWQQDWSAIYPLVEPYPGVAGLDVTGGLKKGGYDAVKLARQAELLHLARHAHAAGQLLAALDAAQAGRPRCAMPCQCLGHRHEGRCAHQDVHRTRRRKSAHDLPRIGPCVLLPGLQRPTALVPDRCQ